MYTVENIQHTFYQSNSHRYEIIAPNIYLDSHSCEMDIMGLRPSGYIDEIEIKLSSSDFKADFKKTLLVEGNLIKLDRYQYYEHIKKFKHEELSLGNLHPNRFYFLIPEDLIDKCVIPEYAGVYIYSKNRIGYGVIRQAKQAKLLHKRKISNELKLSIGRKMAYRYWNVINGRVNNVKT